MSVTYFTRFARLFLVNHLSGTLKRSIYFSLTWILFLHPIWKSLQGKQVHCKSFHKTTSLKRVLFTAQGNMNIFPLTDFLKLFSEIISLSTIKKGTIQMTSWPLLFLHLMVQEIWLVNSNCIQLSKRYTHTHTHKKQLTRQSTDCKNTLTSRAALSSSYLFFDSILSFFNHEILRVFLYINYLDIWDA